MVKHKETKVNGRVLKSSVEFSSRKHKGRFHFVEYVVNDDGLDWVTGYGGDTDPRGRRSWVSVSPQDIKAVHNKKRMR